VCEIWGHETCGPCWLLLLRLWSMLMSDAAQTPIKLGKRGRDDSDGGSGVEDEGRPRRYALSILHHELCATRAMHCAAAVRCLRSIMM